MNELIKENEKVVGKRIDQIIATARSEAPDSLYAVIVYKFRMESIYDNEMNIELLSDVVLLLQPKTLPMDFRKKHQIKDGGFLDKKFLTYMFFSQVNKELASLVVDSGLNNREWENAELYVEKYSLFSSISDADDYLVELENERNQLATDWQNQNPNAPHPFINNQVRTH